VVAPAGVDHGLTNDSTELLLVLVMVAPPPAHMKRPGS
jgi:quercetin dioxygenase-like cupin family protein